MRPCLVFLAQSFSVCRFRNCGRFNGRLAKWWAGGRVSSEPVQGFLCKTCKGTGLTKLEPEKGDAGTGSGKAHEGKGSGGGSRSRSRARTALRGATYREQV